MAASTSRISAAATFALTAAIAASVLPSMPPMAEALVQRGSGRINVELAYRGSGRLEHPAGQLLSYRASGRLETADSALAYRGSERGIQDA